jgi:hypothetical protein
MKANLECGQQKLFGFINVDADPWVRPDVVAVPMDLPFERGSLEEMHAARVLEQLADPVDALRYWRGLLQLDGVLWVAVAEPRAACAACVGDGAASMRVGGAVHLDESRPDHCFSPYFLTLCLRAAGYGEIIRVSASPYARPDGPRLLTYRAVHVHPVRNLARRLWATTHTRTAARHHPQLPA